MVQWVRSPDGADVEITVRPNHWQARPRGALAAGSVLAALLAGLGAGTVAGAFWQAGAWPVVPFAALAAGGLAVALWWHTRSAGDYERLIFHDRRLRIVRHRGHHDEIRDINLAFATLLAPAVPPGLSIACHGRVEHIGDCLGAGELRRLRRLLHHLLGCASGGKAG